jgi:hypothetical protein
MRAEKRNCFVLSRSRLVAVIVSCCAAAIGLSFLAAGAPASATTGQASARRPAAPTAPRLAASRFATLRQRQLAALRQHSGSITGVVAGADGRQLTGACVTAIGSSRSITTSTGPTGNFDITGLAAGSYLLEYRDCASPASYLTRWSGGTAWQLSATRVQVAADQVSHVPTMRLRPTHPAALLPDRAAWRRMLANADRPLSAAAAATKGKITGVVTGKGRPLAGICVEVLPTQSGFGYGATTGKKGAYTIGNVAPGRYYVIFEPMFQCPDRANWAEQNYRGHNEPFFVPGNVVKVSGGKTTSGINASLIRGGQISGTVTTRSGRGLPGICVQLNGQFGQDFLGAEFATGRGGGYVLHGLLPGRYSLNFSTGCGNNGNYAPAFPAPVKIAPAEYRTVSVRLSVGAILTGTVRFGSNSGPALSGICVQASNSSGSITASAATGADGSYSLNSLGTGVYSVTFTPGCNNIGNYVQVTKYTHAIEGKVTSGVDAVLQQGAEITGKVTNSSGTGLGGMCIEMAGPGSPNIPDATNPDGSYLINEMAAGTYELGFAPGCDNSGNYAPYFYDNQDDPSLASPIPVAAASVHVINAQMQAGGEVAGTVTNAGGRKLTGVCVGAATPFDAEIGDVFARIVFSQNGRYQLTGLEPGQYYISFGCGAASGRYASQWFPDAPSIGTAQLVSVVADQTSGIGGVLQPGGRISGVVTGNSGRPLASVCVQLFNAKTGASVTSPLFGPTTNSAGAYQVSGLPAGSYDVEFYPCLSNSRYASQWYRGQAVQTAATPVKVRAGATTVGVNARLTIGGSISGRVAGADGKPLDNICVSAYNPYNGLFASGTTGKAGTYLMLGVSTGSYTVEFGPCFNQNLVIAFAHTKVVAPMATTGVNATLLRGGSVAGVITTAGATPVPVANECAEVVSANPNNPGGLGVSALGGKYLATGIAPGSYTVYFGDPACGLGPPNLVPDWYDNQLSQASAQTITVTAGQTTAGIDAALPTTGEITGTVSHGPSGAPVSGACVTAYPTAAGSAPIVAVSRDGSYSLIDLQPGGYRVEFSSGCGATGYRAQWWRDTGSASKATVITVPAAQVVSDIDATLGR